MCALDATRASMYDVDCAEGYGLKNACGPCNFLVDDPWLAATVPAWRALGMPAGATVTRPWTNGFSSPRLLGGVATQVDATHYTPNVAYDCVHRAADGSLQVRWHVEPRGRSPKKGPPDPPPRISNPSHYCPPPATREG